MYSPSRSPLPTPSPPDSSGSSQCTRPEHLSSASHLGSTILSSNSLICSSDSVILLLILSSVFFTSFIVLFITLGLFFSSSKCFLNISCIFFKCAFTLFPRFWIIFTIITLNALSGRLPTSSSFIWPYVFLPCSFICNILLCNLIFSNLLYLWSPFCRLQGHSSSCFCCLTRGECIGSEACVGFLMVKTGASALVVGAESFPSNW